MLGFFCFAVPWRELLPFLMLTRVPLLSALALVLLPVIALKFARPLLANLFDMDLGGMAVVTLSALCASWTTLLTGWVIFSYGSSRFPGVVFRASSELPHAQNYAFAALLAIPTLIAILFYAPSQAARLSGPQFASARLSRLTRLLAGAIIGAACAAVVLWAAAAVFSDLTFRGWFTWPFDLVFRWCARNFLNPAGYLDSYGDLLPGHLLSTILFIVTLALYLGVGIAHYFRSTRVPSYTYVLLLLMLTCWGMSGLTFAADRWRIPIVLVCGILLAITAWLPTTDHFYGTHRKAIPRAANPAEVLLRNINSKVILVAASGGGIQAAAWTARVLTGLEINCRSQFSDFRFARSIRLISSVSGGSVGAMYFTNRYDVNGQLPANQELQAIVDEAGSSSLEDVSWGLAYPDLIRSIFPFLSYKIGGRGRALERAWTRVSPEAQRLRSSLADWFDPVSKGLRPANIFNATIAESGDRLLLSTTYLEYGKSPATARWDFHEMYHDHCDVEVVTAARLSATFPFVTPASRAVMNSAWQPQPHVVDGGYYDNYGVSTLVEWLDLGLEDLQKNKKLPSNFRVLVLEIHETADPRDTTPPAGSTRGWFYQIFAPLEAMFAVRTAGQRSHDQVELKLLQQKWAGKVAIETVAFEFGGSQVKSDSVNPEFENPPLTWHLTERQKQAIEDQWQIRAAGPEWQQVRDFLA